MCTSELVHCVSDAPGSNNRSSAAVRVFTDLFAPASSSSSCATAEQCSRCTAWLEGSLQQHYMFSILLLLLLL
jgi:hypothetical protein